MYLAARDRERGAAAVAQLMALGLAPRFPWLEMRSDDSVALAEVLRQRHGGVDVVIGNAAARMDRSLSFGRAGAGVRRDR